MPTYEVTITVSVDVDESKFTPEFLKDYAAAIYDDVTTVEEHRANLAELFAMGSIRGFSNEEFEGYGRLSDKGINLNMLGISSELVD